MAEKTFIEKEAMVLQAKFIEEYKHEDKTFYVYGIAFKNKDVGLYYSPIKDQEYFLEGHTVKYQYSKDEKEPKKSKIKPVSAKTTTTSTQVNNPTEKAKNGLKYDDLEKYIAFKKIDAVSFSASYAKDIIVSGDTKDKTFAEIATEILTWTLENLDKQK